MAHPIELHLKEDVDLSGALVLLGAPGLGLVGSITARYLVEQLGMERVGGFHSPDFPPYAPIEAGRPLHPVRVHTVATRCGLDLTCDRLVVVTSEALAGARLMNDLGRTLIDWSESIDAALVLVPDAIAAGDPGVPGNDGDGAGAGGTDDTRVYGIGATDAAMDFLGRAGLEPLPEGAMLGLTAALLSAGEHRGRDVAAMLAVSAPDHPDARAAARLVEVMDRVLPGVRIEAGPLRQRAEEIERQVAAIRAQLQQQAGQAQVPSVAPSVEMFH